VLELVLLLYRPAKILTDFLPFVAPFSDVRCASPSRLCLGKVDGQTHASRHVPLGFSWSAHRPSTATVLDGMFGGVKTRHRRQHRIVRQLLPFSSSSVHPPTNTGLGSHCGGVG